MHKRVLKIKQHTCWMHVLNGKKHNSGINNQRLEHGHA